MSDTPEDPDLLAGEYVLGVLEPEAARALERRALQEPTLAAAIAAWQDRLAPLGSLLGETPAPGPLWARIARDIGETPAVASATVVDFVPRAPRRSVWSSLALWRGATAAGFALAAGFAGILLLRPPTPPAARYVAALTDPASHAAGYMAAAGADGAIAVMPLTAVQVASDRSLELWALPPGAAHPVSLGVLGPDGRRVLAANMVAPNTQLMVSLEPHGGSPTGLPTGPVLFAGALTRAE